MGDEASSYRWVEGELYPPPGDCGVAPFSSFAAVCTLSWGLEGEYDIPPVRVSWVTTWMYDQWTGLELSEGSRLDRQSGLY